MVEEQVVIDIVAKNSANDVLNTVKRQLQELSGLNARLSGMFSNMNIKTPKFDVDTSKFSQGIANIQDQINYLNKDGNLSNLNKQVNEISAKTKEISKGTSSTVQFLAEQPKDLSNVSPLEQPSLFDEKKTGESIDKTNEKLEKLRQTGAKIFKENNVEKFTSKLNDLRRNFAKDIVAKLRIETKTNYPVPYKGGLVPSSTNVPAIMPSTNSSVVPYRNLSNVPALSSNLSNVPALSSNISNSLVPVTTALTTANTALTTTNSTLTTVNSSITKTGESFVTLGKNGQQSSQNISNSFRAGMSDFHQLNNLLITVGGQFTNLASSIAGLFGANSLGGMIEKMWKGASERQTNMLYLIHQKGVSQANEYYNEIMDIVAKLPGDDTFLTNILNMASAMDENIKLDNLKELGSAITDYYIASTMKGELPFETQKDLRKYLTTGETKSLRNSLLANEIELLDNKNSVLERGQALQEALDRNGFAGMSQYESATNALEEFRGHFQKAFADLGTIVTGIVQPLLKLYNTLDTIFGSRLSQGIIIVAMVLITFLTVLGTGMIVTSIFFRNLEMLGFGMNIFARVSETASVSQSIFTAVMYEALGVQEKDIIVKNGGILATMRSIKADFRSIFAKNLYTLTVEQETMGIWASIVATGGLVKSKIMDIATTIKQILFGVDKKAVDTAEAVLIGVRCGLIQDEVAIENAKLILSKNALHLKLKDLVLKAKDIVLTGILTVKKILSSDANILEATTQELNTLATEHNTIAKLLNIASKIRELFTTISVVGAIIIGTIIEWTNTEAVFANTYAHVMKAEAVVLETGATYGLATAVAILDVLLAPEVAIILAIVGAILLLVVVIEKVGEAFGWWEDFGSMIQAIADGIGRLWNAFMGSDIIQGIIQYFGDFFATIQDVFGSIYDLFAKLFGWETSDNGTFDIVQSIINVFGQLGEMIKWVWNLMDDWSNSPLGIITWLNPLGILLFHLDELGSFFEDIRDAIDIFAESTEFNELMNAFNEIWTELQEPFQEIWDLLNEIMGLFGEVFQDPEGQGTEERINFLVEILKGLAFVIKSVIIPLGKALVFVVRQILLPIRIVLTVIKAIIGAIQSASEWLGIFTVAWEILMIPIKLVQTILQGISNVVKSVSDAIKNSMIGKLLGWDKEDNKDDSGKNAENKTLNQAKLGIMQSGMDSKYKQSLLGTLNEQQGLTNNNVNNVRNLGRTYNNNSSQRNVIINQNFSEGSIPVDARNMTKKEARKMFIGAFGYNRSVGSRGILR